MVLRRMFFAGVFFVVSCLAVSSGFAADFKLGVMNVQKIIVSCDAGKQAKVRFENKMKDLQQKFKGEEDALKKLQDEIKKKSSAWSEEKKAEKIREFQKNGGELQAKTEDARFEMKQMQDKELQPILKALENVVSKYGKDNGYTAIMDSKSGIVYFDKTVDISDIVVKELNKALVKK